MQIRKALHVTMKYLLFLALLSPLSYAEIREIDLGDGLSLVLDEMDFDTATNTVTIDSDSKKYRVNGRYPFGTDFGNPQSILVSAVLKYEDKAYDLDVSNMYNTKGSDWISGECGRVEWCTVRATFSTGGGFYGVEWSVRNGDVARTVISDSSEVVDLLHRSIAERRKHVTKQSTGLK